MLWLEMIVIGASDTSWETTYDLGTFDFHEVFHNRGEFAVRLGRYHEDLLDR